MKKNKTKSGKQQRKTAKRGTENRKTHDVKPLTVNTKHTTARLSGPISDFESCVLCHEWRVLND